MSAAENFCFTFGASSAGGPDLVPDEPLGEGEDRGKDPAAPDEPSRDAIACAIAVESSSIGSIKAGAPASASLPKAYSETAATFAGGGNGARRSDLRIRS